MEKLEVHEYIVKQRFPNSKEQLKIMRNERKRRKRMLRSGEMKKKRAGQVIAEGQALVDAKLKDLDDARKMHEYLARRYYDRWRELTNRRKQSMAVKKISNEEYLLSVKVVDCGHLEKPLCNNGKTLHVNIGEGTFGCCHKMMYHGIPVAVKHFKGLSSLADVKKEASILNNLSHPGIPLVFGICTTKPYLLILNFYCVNGQSYTLSRMLRSTTQMLSHQSWIKLLIDVIEALLYIHSKCFIHGDLKSDNIVVSHSNNKYSPVIIDFGKCTKVSECVTCKVLTAAEQLLYKTKYPHIAPEIVSGLRPSFSSDVYSLGLILGTVCEKLHACLYDLQVIVKCCTEVNPCKRISLLHLLAVMKSFSCKCLNNSH